MSSSFSFYVTAGRGTETFAGCEIQNKLLSRQEKAGSQVDSDCVQVRDGKIFFEIPDKTESNLEKILSLRCVERAFVTIADYENITKGKREFLNSLMDKMSTTQNYWMANKVLDQLSSIMCERKWNKRTSQKPIMGEPRRKVAKLDNVTLSCNCDEEQGSSICGDIKEGSESDLCDVFKKSSQSHDLFNCEREREIFKTFRISVKCSGKSRKWINVKKLSKDLSWRVSKASDWIVDLRNPDFEICLHVSDDHITAGVPLTRTPLSRRPFILDPGLRAPVAWIMGQLAGIQPGDTVLDPMCGKGTLLLEACSQLKGVCYLGTDLDSSQLQVAQTNVQTACYEGYIHLFHADALCLPLRTGCVDCVLCDVPFNQKHFMSKSAGEFYASLLQQMHRVFRVQGRFVLLTSQDLSTVVSPLLQTSQDSPSLQVLKKSGLDSSLSVESDGDFGHKLFQLVSKHYIKLGETHGEIIVMNKISDK